MVYSGRHFMDFPRYFIIRLSSLLGCILTGLGILPLCAGALPVQKHLEITGTQRLELTYDYTGFWPRGSGYSATFHLPVPPETGTQHIERFQSNWQGHIQTDEANPPHRILTATLHHGRADEREFHWRVQVVGLFQRRQLVDGPPLASDHSVLAPPVGEFLESTPSINWDSDTFQNWLTSSHLRRADDEAAVDYGARVFAYLKNEGRYSYPPETAWTAAAGCRRLRTDCGGFSLIFVAACRANKIPARLLVGQWLKTRDLSDGTVDLTGRQAHVIAEFFDPQVGWIPEDISSTLLKVPGFADTNFFGRDPGYFFAWHVDTDFHFAVPQNPNVKVQWIQNPSLWFSADAEDASESTSHHWTVVSAGRPALPTNSAP